MTTATNINVIKAIFSANRFTYRGEQFGQHEWHSNNGKVITADWNGREWIYCEFKDGVVIRSFKTPEVASKLH